MIPPLSSSPDPDPDDRLRPSGRRRNPRVVLVAFVLSALVHFLFLVVYPRLMARIGTGPPAPAAPGPTAEPRGIEVVQIAEVPVGDVVEPEEPDEPVPVTPPDEAAPAPVDVGDTDVEAVERRSAAERLRVPGEGDARIWRSVDGDLTELTDEEWAQIRLRERFRSISDSMAAEIEAAEQAMDWTYTDSEGNRWGISPGRLHLGSYSIPLPFSFSAPASARDQATQWQLEDVQRGAQTSIVRDTWKERIEAIRRRRDRERADSTGSRP